MMATATKAAATAAAAPIFTGGDDMNPFPLSPMYFFQCGTLLRTRTLAR
jgi:hypothetical protein